jgi:hypothetical protein
VRRRAENDLCTALRVMGAVSPATSRPGKDLVVDKSAFENLLRRGIIREGSPGTYYLYESETRTYYRTVVVNLFFWIGVILLPIGIIEMCSRTP